MNIAQKLQTIAENEQKVYEAGYGVGHEAGDESGRKAIMDAVQNYGDRTNYNYGFMQWNSNAIYPTHDMICSSCLQMFSGVKGELFDLSARLKECGVKLDTSKCTSFSYTFLNCNSTSIPEIDTRGASAVEYLCTSTSTVITVDNIILRDDGSQTFKELFSWSTSIENIKITGVIGKNGFNVSSLSKLTHESLMSIINALQDKTGTSGTWTVTLGGTNLAKLTEDEIAIAEAKGWEIA